MVHSLRNLLTMMELPKAWLTVCAGTKDVTSTCCLSHNWKGAMLTSWHRELCDLKTQYESWVQDSHSEIPCDILLARTLLSVDISFFNCEMGLLRCYDSSPGNTWESLLQAMKHFTCADYFVFLHRYVHFCSILKGVRKGLGRSLCETGIPESILWRSFFLAGPRGRV